MKHHFGDLLGRDGDYWTIVPNREKYAYRIGDVRGNDPDITIVTIGKDDEHWQRVLTLPNLEELTLHEPSPEQLEGVGALRRLRRLRITHARPKNLTFMAGMESVEELVLEYVSGCDDLLPLSHLKRLRSLHVENLRQVASFAGLSGLGSLQYLAIHGTLDWLQPIADFEFLRGLANLEVLALFQLKCLAAFPALLPALELRHLENLRVSPNYLPAEECALLEVGLPSIADVQFGPYREFAVARMQVPADDIRARLPEATVRANHPEVAIWHDGRRMIDDPDSLTVYFTGRGAGQVKRSSKTMEARCQAYAARYEEMKSRARAVIENARTRV